MIALNIDSDMIALILTVMGILTSGILMYKKLIPIWVHVVILVSVLVAQNIWYFWI